MFIAAFISGVLLLFSTPVAAHMGFESSSPADGATLGEPIAEIVLTYSGPAQPAGERFVILEPTGVTRQPDSVTSDDEQQVWTLGFDRPLAGGSFGVRWAVQAPDAHPIDGAFSFTVTAPPLQTDPATDAQTTAPAPTGTIASNQGAAGDLAPQDLDAFLAQSNTSAPYAETLGVVGRLLGLTAAMIGVGGTVFAATVIWNRRRDIVSVLMWARLSGAVLVLGAVVELVAQLAVTGNEWSEPAMFSAATVGTTMLAPFGAAVGLRVIGGFMLLSAATSQSEAVKRLAIAAARRRTAAPVGVAAGPAGDESAVTAWPPALSTQPATPPAETSAYSTSQPLSTSPRDVPVTKTMVLAVLGLLLSYTFDGHTVSEGNRWFTGLVDTVHVAAGAVWVGGVFALAWVLWSRHRRGVQLRALELAVRFSVIAGAALVVAGLAGSVLAVIILDSPAELWSTPWGRLLAIKFLAVGTAAALGAFNHFMVIPWMNDDPNDETRSIWLRNMVTGEATVLGLVVAVTAFLVGAAS